MDSETKDAARVLLVIDGIPSVAKHIAERLKELDLQVCEDPVLYNLPHPPQTFDRRDAFIKRTDKRLNHNPQAYLNINRRQTRRRF